MQISGNVEKVVFRSLDTGYSVLELQTITGSETVSGKFPLVGEGERVTAFGDYQNTRYGRQFVAEKIQVDKPTNKENLTKYLSSGLISGVGPVTAKNIVNTFGDETLEIIEKYPKMLARIKGISITKAVAISQAVQDIKKMQEAVMFLQGYDVSINLAVKIYDCYKQNTEKIISKNPYKLVEDIDGIGFKTADKIALKLGIPEDSEFRIRAAFINSLTTHAERNGSTVISQSELINLTCALLGARVQDVTESYEKVLVKMIIDGVVQEYVEGDSVRLAFTKFANYEKSIARHIERIKQSADCLVVDIDADIKTFEQKRDIVLHDEQKRAIKTAVQEGVAIITGGPGTGKTTIVKCIIDIFKKLKKVCVLMAPTGRAAKRLSESTGYDAGTIHRMLQSGGESGFRRFGYNELEPLPADVVLVDEVSMLDAYLASNLLKAVRSGARLILVGDKDQLPSVGAGNVLADLINSDQVTTVALTQIFRQAEESQIVVNAHRINNGQMPVLNQKEGDFFFSAKEDALSIQNEIVSLVSNRLPKFNGVEWKNIQVLCPTKMGASGTVELNAVLQKKLNPKSEEVAVELSGKKFAVGDRVMQTTNNYEQSWTKEETLELGCGVFNGDIGYITEVNPKSGEVVVLFEDGRKSTYSFAESSDLSLAYAITIHKSQGSEFDVVIVPVAGGNPFLFNRNLLYTAVTRAKKMVVLVGKREHISYMVWNTKMARRETMLCEFLKKMANGEPLL